MVSIPVRLHKAARRERIRFRRVYHPAEIPEPETPEQSAPPEEEERVITKARTRTVQPLGMPAPVGTGAVSDEVARVRSLPITEMTGTPVEKQKVLKGYEIEPNRYVTLEPNEVAALRPPTSTDLDIVEFVRMEEIDPLFLETSYFAGPDHGGEKAYALLFRALSETGYAAIGSLAMHGREHTAVIRPGRRGLILHTLFYAHEVRDEEEYAADGGLVRAKELDLAKLLVGALTAKFDPSKHKDSYEERLRELIETRAAAGMSAYHGHQETARRAPVVDIMDALRQSLAAARKPPRVESRTKMAARSVKGIKRRRRPGS